MDTEKKMFTEKDSFSKPPFFLIFSLERLFLKSFTIITFILF